MWDKELYRDDRRFLDLKKNTCIYVFPHNEGVFENDDVNKVYYAGAGVFPNSRQRQSRDRLSTMEIHVDSICALVCIRRYTVSRYVFPISIILVGHLSCIAEIMWSIISRQN